MINPDVVTDYKTLHVRSASFPDHGMIPGRYTCDGANVSPSLEVSDIPMEAKSMCLIVEDPDATTGTWLHWLVWNIPTGHHIKEGEIPGNQGMNDFGHTAYGGPCPPTGTHRYFFKVYALDTLLQLGSGATRKQIENAMRDHILAFGETVGLYKRLGQH